MTTNLKQSALAGVKWATVSQVGQQAIAFVTTLLLVRLLAPADFGLLNMALIVIGFVRIFRDLGTGSAIVQRQDLSDELLSSLFWVNLVFGLLMTLLLAAAAPAVSWFYQEPRVTPILRVLSLIFFISCLSILQQALLQRALAFDRLARLELAAGVIGSGVGIGAALLGGGVWSLVYQALAGTVATTLLLWLTSSWYPRRLFSWTEVRAVSSYSLNLTGFNVFNYFERNLDNILVGRFLGAQALGYYALAYRLMLYPIQNISHMLTRVMFPSFARIQDDDERFRRVYLQVTGALALVTFPMYCGLVATRTPLILTIFGPQWRPVIPLILVLGFVGMVQSVAIPAGAIFRAKGRTDWQLRWGLAITFPFALAFLIGLRWGVVGVATAYAVTSAVLIYPTFAIPFRLIGLRVSELCAPLWRPFACSALMFAGVAGLEATLPATWGQQTRLAILVATGIALYLAASWLVNREQICSLLETVGVRRRLARIGVGSWVAGRS